MKKPYDFTVKEADAYLRKRLGFKTDNTYVKKLNTLRRIIKFINDNHPLWNSTYPNNNIPLKEVSSHYWIDIWVGATLLSYRYNKQNNV